ncbi:hypothetical protein Goe2_c20100 [Bacillus phage vB_BsuM-Goe2]|uniref:Uncharacterized protein n=1 Tax=Bacillus phage vB_BsuM-Goe2 TaxID=1933062 RepID=A0A217EQV0_9CAUD|nr:hypothetical protein Goe2_c20100 [Bacillus phage vB_BsuM-Goe2]
MVVCEKCKNIYNDLSDSTCADCKYLDVLKQNDNNTIYYYVGSTLRHATLRGVNEKSRQVLLETSNGSWNCMSFMDVLTRDRVSIKDLKELLLNTLQTENLYEEPNFEEQRRLLAEIGELIEVEEFGDL